MQDFEGGSGEPLLATVAEFKDFLFQKLVPLEDMGVEKELFHYWRKQELLPFFPKGAWARFSFAQMIWVRILQDLRGFDYTVVKMRRLADYLFKRAYRDNLPERNLRSNLEALEKRRVAGVITEAEVALLQYLEGVLGDEALLHSFKYNVNYLTELIMLCLNSGEETGLLLFFSGKVGEYRLGTYYSGAEVDGDGNVEGGGVGGVDIDPTEPHIYLSIRHYLREFLASGELGKVATPLQLFSEGESKVLRAIKDPRNKEVRVELKSGRVQRVEAVTEDVILKGSEAEALRKALGLKNYERILVDTVDEKTLVVRKTKKKL